uniref:Uncharacterized protein n=1 Tax=Rhizophora mucronata TaxID=61149 RepID=A0A2P2II41_RHIMU
MCMPQIIHHFSTSNSLFTTIVVKLILIFFHSRIKL